jgi:MATE family multidrug resistance protein
VSDAALAPNRLARHVRATLVLAWPVMLARAGMLIMAMVDAAMIGRVSGEGLAYYGVAMAPFLFFLLTGIGLLIGTVVLVAQAKGEDDLPRCGVIWRLSLLEATLYAAVVTALLSPGPPVLALLGQAPTLAAEAGRVLQALALGMWPMLLFTATSLYLEGLGRPRPGMVVMLSANVVNAGLNALLLFGWWGLPEWGAAGAALATSLTRYLMAAVLVGYVLALGVPSLAGTGLFHDARRQAGKLVRLGLPVAGANALESSAFTTMSMFAGWLGTLPAAAYLVCLNFSALVYMLAIGLGTATAVRVGQAIGRREAGAVPLAGWTGVGLGLAIMAVIAPLVLAFRPEIAAFYTGDAAVIAYAVPALTLVAGLLFADASQGILIGALRGAGDVRIPLGIQVIAYLGIAIPLGYGLGFTAGLGIEGLILGLFAGLGAASLLLAWRFVVLVRGPIAAF